MKVSFFNCPMVVDRKGMPVNRAILTTDRPSQPAIAVCQECGVQHRVAGQATR